MSMFKCIRLHPFTWFLFANGHKLKNIDYNEHVVKN